jgi:cold shock CspA family protein/ribosome-associated translation inhibitor RaiA
MQQALQIAFRNMDPSDAVATIVREKVSKLERFCQRIQSCRVVIEEPHRHQHQGKLYRVRIDLKVPGREIVVGGDTSGAHASEDIRAAIRDTFQAAQRRLQDYVRSQSRLEQGRDAETREGAAYGTVLRIIREGGDTGYGFIQAPDGREIYFHRNSVLDDHFDDLAPGMEVRFAEEPGEEGPQASTVQVA